MLGRENEVEMLQPSNAANSQTKSRRQSGRCPAVDQELGSIVQSADCVLIRVVVPREFANLDLADLAAAAAAMNVVRDYPRSV